MSVRRVRVLIVIVLGLVVATAVFVVLVIRSRNQQIERYRRAYAEIKIGDSRDAVIVGMGKPYEVTGCSYTPFADPKEEAEFRAKCFQQYRYALFMREYKVSFDRNGAVIGKTASVSP